MNWRLLTTINAMIALVTVAAVIYDLSRPRPGLTRTVARQTPVSSNVKQDQLRDREAKARVEALTDFSEARVDDLGAVPPAELTQLMVHATPDQLAQLATKFNEAPLDARTFGGMGVFFQAWTHLDPKAAMSGAFDLNDLTMRKLAITAVVNSASPSAAPELIAFLAEHPDKDLAYERKDTFLEPLLENWSSLDPETAAKYMDELGDTKSRVNMMARRKIAYNWGTLDPAAALEWVAKQKDKDFVDDSTLRDGLVSGWCLKDLSAASNYVAQNIDDPNVRYAASSVATALFSRDPQAAMDWVSRLPDGYGRSDAESTIASTWADKDPAAGAHWLQTLPEKNQTDIVGTIVTSWISQNSSDAFHWISTLTGEVHDQAIVAAMNRDDATFADSLSIVFEINDQERRSSVIENNIRNWALNDPEAAEAWVKASPLSEEQRQKLLTTISETRAAAAEATAEQEITTE